MGSKMLLGGCLTNLARENSRGGGCSGSHGGRILKAQEHQRLARDAEFIRERIEGMLRQWKQWWES